MEYVQQITELEINSRAEEVFTAMSPRCTIEEMELMRRAYQLAHDAHAYQKRMTGEPYIIHPVAVAKILARFGMDNETVIAGLLHDAVEDTDYTRAQLIEDFDLELIEDDS